MVANTELNGLHELLAALLEERRNIVAGVAKLRSTRRRKGTFVPGDGAAAGPGFVAVQAQIAAVAAVIEALTEGEDGRVAAE